MVVTARLLVLLTILAFLAVLQAAVVTRGAISRGEDARAEAPPAADSPPPLTPLTGARRANAPAPAAGGGPRLSSATRGAPARVPSGASPRPRLFLARVRAGRTVALRSRPGGGVRARLGDRTRFGSAQVLGVAAVRGRWLGVASTARPDGGLLWVDRRSAALRVSPTRVSIRIDLSARRLELLRGTKVVRRAPVAVGRPGSRTPTGRFAVTDKLDGRRFGPYYGCCVLALSGEQPNLPVGWTGGNRLAVHGTDAPAAIGKASSAGCLRAAEAPLRVLMRRVPLGTPVRVVA